MASALATRIVGRVSARHALIAAAATSSVAGLAWFGNSQEADEKGKLGRIVVPQLERAPANCDGAIARLGTRNMLRELTDMWTKADQDTWPWVWIARSPPLGRCYLLVGTCPSLLNKARDVLAGEPHATVVLMAPKDQLTKMGPIDDRVVVLDSSVGRVDPESGIVLTRDERIIEFDSLHVKWAKPPRRSWLGIGDEEEQQGERLGGQEHRMWERTPSGNLKPKKGSGKGNVPLTDCDGSCRRMVKRKSLHTSGEGLHQIVQAWKRTETDTWPWVWLWRNPEHPLHVIVGSGREAVQHAQQLASRASGSNVVIVGSRQSLRSAASGVDFDAIGAAVVEGDVEELDASHGIIMLSDERLIEFDSLTIIRAESDTAHV